MGPSLHNAILGRTLGGRFRVTGFIGEGAMAAVYRAVQEAEPHDVALKIMHPHLVADVTFVGRFRREAKAASRIVHPNTVRIIDTGVDGNLLYIAMELLAGRDLFEQLVLDRRLAEARAARIMVEVTDALVAAHDKGIVHRDLKPENIMLLDDPASPSGERVKVLDFGIAKILEQDSPSADGGPSSMASSSLTGVGTVVGTPAYMSPEQCRGELVDERSDIYTCGILLYQLLSGRLPFPSNNTMDIAVHHVRTPPPPLAEIVPGVHPGLAALIDKTLAKWPSQRPASAAEIRDSLRALLPELSVAPLTPATVIDPPVAAAAWPLRRESQEAITQRPSQVERPPLSDPDPDSAGDTLLKLKREEVFAAASAASTMETPTLAAAPGLGPRPASLTGSASPRPASLTGSASPRPASSKPRKVWWVVPLALVLGMAMGAAAFWLSRG